MRLFAALCAALCATIVACSSAPAKKNVDAGPAEVPEQADGEFLGVAPGNLDTAHAAFIQALNLELRGLQHEADSMWMLAWRYDPRSRYLSFKVAQKRVESNDLFMQSGRSSMRDILEAESALLTAQNALCSAVVEWRTSELSLRSAMGILAINDDGTWR